jgi:hypothetical protein
LQWEPDRDATLMRAFRNSVGGASSTTYLAQILRFIQIPRKRFNWR